MWRWQFFVRKSKEKIENTGKTVKKCREFDFYQSVAKHRFEVLKRKLVRRNLILSEINFEDRYDSHQNLCVRKINNIPLL